VLTGSVELTIIAEQLSPAEGPVQGCRSRADDRVSSGQTLAMCQCSEDLANVAAAPRTRPSFFPMPSTGENTRGCSPRLQAA
jgi:hypothetical protein